MGHILCIYDDKNIRNIKCIPWNCHLGKYRGADKSLARPGRKEANVSVRMALISFDALPCRKKI